jgi:hypothetical protein
MNSYLRTATEMFSGKLCFNDVVFFKIQKYRYSASVLGIGNSATSSATVTLEPTPIKTIYVPSSHKDVITYFDTQVKYGGRYHYKVYAVNATFGTEYQYKPILRQREVYYDVENNAHFNIIVKPKVELYEVPYCECDVMISDLPPTPPTVELIPIIGDGKKIKMAIGNTYGDLHAKPIVIKPTDIPPVERAKLSQTPDARGRIKYSGDDKIDRYEIFRLGIRPETPEDFGIGILRYVETSTPDRIDAKTRETSFY